MKDISTIVQAFAVVMACWAIVSGVGAWKREFIGKRQIELAENILARFFEVRDAIAFIRNPFSRSDEGSSRQRSTSERAEESRLLDRAYIVVERYQKKESVFNEFAALKYRCMATFGTETESAFQETSKVLNMIFGSANVLGSHYWPRQGRVPMGEEEFQKHLEEMNKHEGIFRDTNSEKDSVRLQLQTIQTSLETITAPCFKEPMKLFSVLTTPFGKRLTRRCS